MVTASSQLPLTWMDVGCRALRPRGLSLGVHGHGLDRNGPGRAEPRRFAGQRLKFGREFFGLEPGIAPVVQREGLREELRTEPESRTAGRVHPDAHLTLWH